MSEIIDTEGRALQPMPERATPAPANIMAVIARAASDPSVSMDKMERLFAIQKELMARDAETAYSTAMSAAQSEMTRISADATNKQTASNYASYGQIDRALRPIYTKHGFSLSFSDGNTDKVDHVRIVCVVRHSGGHKETHWKDMAADGKGAKGGDVMTKTHAEGSAQQYGMRYLLKGIFNVAIGKDEDDGNRAGKQPEPRMTEQNQAEVLKKCEALGPTMQATVLKSYKAGALAELADAEYQTIINKLDQRIKARGKAA